jgi:hypothetical protein
MSAREKSDLPERHQHKQSEELYDRETCTHTYQIARREISV